MSFYSFLSTMSSMDIFHRVAGQDLSSSQTFRQFPTAEDRHLAKIGLNPHPQKKASFEDFKKSMTAQ